MSNNSKKTALKVSKYGNTAKAFVQGNKLHVKWVQGNEDFDLSYEPKDINNQDFLLEDATRKDIIALKKLGINLKIEVKD